MQLVLEALGPLGSPGTERKVTKRACREKKLFHFLFSCSINDGTIRRCSAIILYFLQRVILSAAVETEREFQNAWRIILA